MRKIIAAINLSVDGFCDHTSINPDDEIHQHYADLIHQAGVLLYGRITYQLMEYWRTILEQPTGNESTDNFAKVMDKIPKIVFTRAQQNGEAFRIDWESATLAEQGLEETVRELKQQTGKDVFIGSPGLITQLTNANLIDEYQLCIHPVIVGKGLPLFKSIKESVNLSLIKTKVFASGAIILYYNRTQ